MGLFSFLSRNKLNQDGTTPCTVTGEEAVQLVRAGAQLLDVRERSEWRSGHAPQAIHLPVSQVSDKATRMLNSARPVVVMCASGMRSRMAATTLRQQGFNAANLKGGINNWIRGGGRIA